MIFVPERPEVRLRVLLLQLFIVDAWIRMGAHVGVCRAFIEA